MKLTETQRRKRAASVAMARTAAELGFNLDKEVAEYLGLPSDTYASKKRAGFACVAVDKFCRMANKMKMTDEEILRIVRARE